MDRYSQKGKVADFGTSKGVSSNKDDLQKPEYLFNEFCGSPGFMAPEMIIDRYYDGVKADWWSIGCILLELILIM